MRGLKLRPGSNLEVNMDIDDRGEVWYPASFVEQVNSNSCLVKLLKSKQDAHQKVVVDLSNMRPMPTHGYRKAFSLMDKVDAFVDNGWWSGVVTKVFDGKRYFVCLDRTKKEKELRHTDLRLHMDWSNSDGKWFHSPPEDHETHTVTLNRARLKPKLVLVSDIVNGTSHNNIAALPHQHNAKMSPSQSPNSAHHLKEEQIKVINNKHSQVSKDHHTPNNGGVRQKKGKTINRKRKRGRPPNVFSQVNTSKTKEADVEDDLRNYKTKALDSIGVQDVEPVGAITSIDVNDGDRSFSGIPSPPTASHCKETGKRQDHNKKQPDGPTKEKDENTRATNVSHENNALGRQNALETGERQDHDKKQPDEPTKEKKDENTQATDVSHEKNALERQNDTLVLSTVVTPLEIEHSPFVKISQVWKMIESMEVFKQIPQKPHFRPLYNCKEESREGLAIGNMITFASLVERVPRLEFWDPKSVIEGYMEALNELEAMGLNVEPVREKLNKLMGIKSREEMAVNTVNEIEMQVVEREHEKVKLSEEISEVDKKIRELGMKRASLVSRREMKDVEIGLLESSKDGVKGSLKGMKEEFEKVAASFC